jgi:hypothetical protein
MKLKYLCLSIISVFALAGCTDDNAPGGGDMPQSGKYQLSGKVEKGPFVRGSSISVQPLDETMTAIGTVFNGEIRDDAGSFDLGQIELASQFVRIVTDGYYFNEVTGSLSTGQLHLIALADLSDRSTVNVNILTHLKSGRIQTLMKGGKNFAEADRQAQTELLAQFGLQVYESTPAESMSISAGTDGSGVLIAISSLVLNERSDAEVTQYLSVLSQDLADDGEFTDDNKRTIAHDRYHIQNNLENIAANIIARYRDLGQDVTIPDLRYFYDWNGDGVAGNEIVDNVEISLSQNEVSFDKDGGTATVQVTSNIPLSIEPYKDPFDIEPSNPVNPGDEFFRDIFVNTGDPINCNYTYENGILTIRVDKTQRHGAQSSNVYLYDAMGTIRADVKVTLAGDPSIPLVLGETGRKFVSIGFDSFVKALSWMYYVERGYTGMYPYYEVKCPFNVYDTYNSRAFNAAYSSIAFNANVIKSLQSSDYSDAAPYFILLNAITYTEMVDKWGRIGISELTADNFEVPRQETVETTLRYLENSLDRISSAFNEKKGLLGTSPDDVFDMPKDVWRLAKANVYMALNEPQRAMSYLQEIVDSRRYTLSAGNEYDANSGTILFVKVPDEVMSGHTMSYYSYADVLLLLAECNIATGNAAKATSLVNQVAKTKNITVSGNNVSDMEKLRKQLYLPRYFAFQKRNGFGDYAVYQKQWPIPDDQIVLFPGWTQNPGY